MGILGMDFERILGVPFFHSSSHSIMLCLKNVVFASLAKSEIVAMIWNKNNVFWHNYFMVTLHINWQIDLAKMWLNFFSSYLQGLIFRRFFFFKTPRSNIFLKGIQDRKIMQHCSYIRCPLTPLKHLDDYSGRLNV